MRRIRPRSFLLLCAASVLMACSSGVDNGDTGHLDAGLLDEVGLAVAALEAGGYANDVLQVQLAESVTWSDGSLGCPQPGQTYTQALVDGYRILITTPDGDVAFHGETGEPPFRCDDPQPPARQ